MNASIRNPMSRPAVRLAVVVALTIAAYHYSLWTIVASMGSETPLAYLGLLPLLAVGVAAMRARPRPGEPEIHDRYLDLIVGVTAVVAALAANVALSNRFAAFSWLWRLDLLTLPFFVAGLVALVFGTRTLMRVWPAVALLFLMWPVPARFGLNRVLGPLTDLTSAAVSTVVGVVPVAQATVGEGQFTVAHAGRTFSVVVAQACAGLNMVIGFGLVGLAVLSIVSGVWWRRALWLVTGLIFMWILNIARIIAIMATGAVWGERAAFDYVHPYAGMVCFALGSVAMVFALGLFGLEPQSRGGAGPRSEGGSAGPGDWLTRARPTWAMSCMAGLLAAAIAIPSNEALRVYDPVMSGFSEARVTEMRRAGLRLAGFTGRRVDRFTWAAQYFGNDADWTRYEYAGPGTPELGINGPVIADVVTTSRAQAFSDYDVEACYRFHGYAIEGERDVDLGYGIHGRVMTWTDPDGSGGGTAGEEWVTLVWHWPVLRGGDTAYQRVVLLLRGGNVSGAGLPAAATTVRSPRPSVEDAAGWGIPETALEEWNGQGDAARRAFLVPFARQIVTTVLARSVES